MRMNSNIILAGETPNFLGALDASNRAAGFKQEMDRTNAFNSMLQQNGAAIMNGDQNALAALAGYDPQAALGIKQTHTQMGYDAEKMQLDREQAARLVEEHASNMSAAQREAEAAKIERAVAAGLAARDPAEWDALMQQFGAADLVGQFGNREAIAYSYMSVAEALKSVRPNGENFRVVGNQVVDLTADGGPKSVFSAENAESGTVVYDPQTGNPIVTTGTAKPAKPFTEGQSKDIVFATRARGALEVLDPVADALVSRVDRAAEYGPLGFGRELQRADYQLADQAGAEFLQAILRKDTGASITEPEQSLYGKTYLPQPGDGPEVLAQKKQARARAVAALEAGMSPAQIIAQERAVAATRADPNSPPPAPDSGLSNAPAPSGQVLFEKNGYTVESLP